MDAETLYRDVLKLEAELEDLRDAVKQLDPHVLPAGRKASNLGVLSSDHDIRSLGRSLRGVEQAISKAAREAREAQHLLRGYVDLEVEHDKDVDPSTDIPP